MAVELFLMNKDTQNLIVKSGKGYVKYNDEFFDANKDALVMDDTIRYLLKKIDGSAYESGTTMRTRYGEFLDIENSSTGCKTAINVYLNPDKIIDCMECGANALVEILKLGRGNIIAHFAPEAGKDTEINVNLHDGNRIKNYRSLSMLTDDWLKVSEEGEV